MSEMRLAAFNLLFFRTLSKFYLLQADIESFMATYSASHPNVRSGERVRYLELEDPFARTAGSLDVDALPLESFASGDDGAEGGSAISQAFKNN